MCTMIHGGNMSEEWKEIKSLLQQAPNEQLDSSVQPMIAAWGEPPTSLQVLEVLDQCAHSALASQFTMGVLNIMLELRLDAEGKTMQDITPLATWRYTNGD